MRKNKYLIVGVMASMLASCGTVNPDADLSVDVENHSDITLKTMFPNFGCTNEKVREGWLGKAIERYTTYNVDYNQFSEAADTEANKYLNTKEPIDMMKITPTIFNNYVTYGYFTDLTDVIEKYGNRVIDSKGTKWKDLYTKEQWEACSYNGRIYGIPEFGHTAMNNQALVWNTDHLKAVGIQKIPETISEFRTALEKLQAKYGPGNQNYYAFGLNGNISVGNPISPAFEVPEQWYVDSNGDLQNMLMAPQMKNYLSFMNGLLHDGFIANDWVSQGEQQCISNFVKENSSVYVGSYWNITSAREAMIATYKSWPTDVHEFWNAKLKKQYVYGEQRRVSYKDDALIGWNTWMKGDGTNGSVAQEKGKARDSMSVGYYCTVPVACAKNAAYVIDWISRRNTEECTVLMIAGEEGKHFDYCAAGDEGAIKLNTKSGEAKYVKTYPDFLTDISGMSQFQTSVNCDVARVWWPVAEDGFNAWDVLIVDQNGQQDNSRMIYNAFGYHPVLPNFASVDLEAQNYVVTQAQYCINIATDSFEATLETARQNYNTRFYSKCASEINGWYHSK